MNAEKDDTAREIGMWNSALDYNSLVMQLASPKSEVGPIWYLHDSLKSRWIPNLLKLLKVTAGMSQMITQSYIGGLTEATVTHSEFSEVLICSEHRADITPKEDTVTWPVRRKEMSSGYCQPKEFIT